MGVSLRAALDMTNGGTLLLRQGAHVLLRPLPFGWLFATVLVFLALCHPPLPELHANEESKLGAALARALGPDRHPYSQFIGDRAQDSAFDAIAGPAVQAMGFEGTQRVGYGLGLMGLAAAIAWLTLHATTRLLEPLGTLATTSIIGQTTMGGEFFVGTFEPKTIAYPLVLAGIALILSTRYALAGASMAIAANFHFQVGVYWAAFASLALWPCGAPRRGVLKFATVSAIGAAPLLAVAAFDQWSASRGIDTSSTSWIYSIYRNPHHVAPFSSREQLTQFLPGAVFTVAMLGWTISTARTFDDDQLRFVSALVGVASGFTLLGFAASALDPAGQLGKFYLFRPAALAFFLFLFVFIASALHPGTPETSRRHSREVPMGPVVTIFAVIWILPQRIVDAASSWLIGPEHRGKASEIATLIRKHMPTDEVVAIPRSVDSHVRESGTEWPLFVSYKFVPTRPDAIVEWHHRIEVRKAISRGTCDFLLSDAIDHFVRSQTEAGTILLPCGQFVASSPHNELVRLAA